MKACGRSGECGVNSNAAAAAGAGSGGISKTRTEFREARATWATTCGLKRQQAKSGRRGGDGNSCVVAGAPVHPYKCISLRLSRPTLSLSLNPSINWVPVAPATVYLTRQPLRLFHLFPVSPRTRPGLFSPLAVKQALSPWLPCAATVSSGF